MNNIRYYAIGFKPTHLGQLQAETLYANRIFNTLKDLINEIKVNPSTKPYKYCLVFKLEGIDRIVNELQNSDYDQGEPIGLLQIDPMCTLYLEKSGKEKVSNIDI